MTVKSLKNAEVIFNMEGAMGNKLHKKNNIEIVHLNIKKNIKLEKHKLPLDVVFYVLNGNGFFYYNDESIKVEKGTLIECPKNSERSWENSGDEDLKVLVIKFMK